MAKLVSKTYGDALFEVAVEEGTLDTMLEEVEAVLQVLKEVSAINCDCFLSSKEDATILPAIMDATDLNWQGLLWLL